MKSDILNNPKTFTLSAMVIGFFLIDDLSALEQNALGNWFITIGQILQVNYAFQTLIERGSMQNNFNNLSKQDIEDIKKTIEYLERRLDKIKRDLNNH